MAFNEGLKNKRQSVEWRLCDNNLNPAMAYFCGCAMTPEAGIC
jgi:hypothetical protein